MSSQLFPKKNAEFIFYVGLPSVADGNIFQSTPTLASGDVKVSIDGGALNNLGTLPDVDPNSSKLVKVLLSSSEMNGDNIQVIFSDASGGEWKDVIINIQTADRQVNDLAFPNTTGRGIDVTTGGGVGIDWSNVEAPTTTLDLSGTTIKTATDIATLISALNNLSSATVAGLLTATLADSIPAVGTRPSIASGILMLVRMLQEGAVVGSTQTIYKEDGVTAAMTFQLNSSTDPTAISRLT